MRKQFLRKCVIGLLLLVMLATLTLLGSTSITQAQPPGDTVQIIVKCKVPKNIAAIAAAVQASGGKDLRDLPQLRTRVISVPARAAENVLAAFANDPSVERATKAIKFHKAGTPDDPGYTQQWALPKIAWDQVYGTTPITGSAIVAVLDTGVDAGHPDLAGRMGSGQSFVNGDANSDPNGHGTALAGIAAANVNNAVGIAGVAYDGVTVSSVQVLQPDGTGLDSDVVAGVVWAVDNGAKVILMGFSSTEYSAALADALQYAWSQGAVLVAATGNDGSSAPSYPAGMENVLGVASTDQDDNLAADSNTGSACVAAPGLEIYTTTPGGNYGAISGTSAAAAETAGLAALLVASGQGNDYIYNQVRGAIDPITGQSFGRINVATAMGEAVTPPPSPVPEPPPTPGPTPPIYAPAAAYIASVTGNWSDTATWGGSGPPVAGDTVTINSGVTVTVDGADACASITINAPAAANGITISGTNTLTVSGAITMNSPTAAVNSTIAVGTGTLNAGSIAIPGSGTAGQNCIVSVSTGTINVTGAITFSGTADQAQLTFTSAGTLNIGGNLGTGGTFTASTGTVNCNRAGAQTIAPYTYNNLTLSGSGVKTFATTPTVNGILSMEGTATVTVTTGVVTYGASATLQYNTATARTVRSEEWITPFAATGGVIIANTGAITMNAAKVFNASVPLTINSGATLATNNFNLTLGGDFINNGGTFNAGSSFIIITGAVAQSIDGFTTTGVFRVTKTGGTATLTGNVNAASLNYTAAAMNGGTVSLNSGVAVTLTGAFAMARPGAAATSGSVFAVNAGSLSCTTISLGGTNITAARSTTLSISTGTVTASGDIASAGTYSYLTFTGAGTLYAGGTFMSGTQGTFTASTGTVNFNAAGAQSIAPFAYTFNNVTLSGSGAKTTTNATINGILSMEGTATTAGTVATYGAAATLQYKGSGVQTTGTEFPATFGGSGGVIINNASGVNLGGSVAITNGLTLTSGTFAVGTNTLTLNGPAIAGTPANLSTTSSSSLVFGGSSSGVNIPSSVAALNNLTINNANGVTLNSSSTISGTLTLTSGNLAVTDPYELTLGDLATTSTTATTDVTGIVTRTPLRTAVSYTFGNQYTAVTFNAGATLPNPFKVKTTLSAPSWKTGAITRTYDIIQTGGSGTTTVNLHYLDTELNGNTENKLVTWTGPTPVAEHGRSNHNMTDNWVGISGILISYFPTAFDSLAWTLGDTVLSDFTWNGSLSTDWSTAANWTPVGNPLEDDDVIIPDASTTLNDPTLPASVSVGRMTIKSGGILDATLGSTITVTGASGAWSSESGGTFNHNSDTVVFTNAAATADGETDFYNVTIDTGAGLTMGTGGTMRIGGTITNNETWRAAGLSGSTIEYNGGDQTVLNPNGATPGYDNLILSGSGTKTMPDTALDIGGNFSMSGTASATAGAAINTAGSFTVGLGTSFTTGAYTHTIGGDFSNSGTFTATGSTITLNGTSAQAMNGATSFNNLTLNNSNGLTISNDETVDGTLTLTSGNIATGSNTVIIGSSGSVSRTSGHVIGNLQKYVATGATSITFEVGTASNYNTVTVDFGSVSVSGNLTASVTSGEHPNIGSSTIEPSKDVNDYWSLTNSGIVFTSYSATFNFNNPGDIDTGADPNIFIVGKYDGGWTYPTVGTRTSTSTQATGMTSFGDFAVGEPLEFISFTVTDYGGDGIKFDSLDPGMNDRPADQNPPTQGAVTLTVGSETNVDVDVQLKGDNFTGSGTILISNVKYNDNNNPSGASTMTDTYATWYTVPANTGYIQQCYHWISIPAGQPPGDYTSTFYYQAIETP